MKIVLKKQNKVLEMRFGGALRNLLRRLYATAAQVAYEVRPFFKLPKPLNPRGYRRLDDNTYQLYDWDSKPIGMIGLDKGPNATYVDWIGGTPGYHGVGEDLYNISVLNQIDGGYAPIISGVNLLSAHKTIPTTNKFPHENVDMMGGAYLKGKFYKPRRLLGTSNKPIPRELPSDHSIEINEEPSILFNEASGDFEWMADIPWYEQVPNNSIHIWDPKY